MTDVLRVRQQQKEPLTRGSWVRMKRNDEYRDDLAQVVEQIRLRRSDLNTVG